MTNPRPVSPPDACGHLLTVLSDAPQFLPLFEWACGGRLLFEKDVVVARLTHCLMGYQGNALLQALHAAQAACSGTPLEHRLTTFEALLVSQTPWDLLTSEARAAFTARWGVCTHAPRFTVEVPHATERRFLCCASEGRLDDALNPTAPGVVLLPPHVVVKVAQGKVAALCLALTATTTGMLLPGMWYLPDRATRVFLEAAYDRGEIQIDLQDPSQWVPARALAYRDLANIRTRIADLPDTVPETIDGMTRAAFRCEMQE